MSKKSTIYYQDHNNGQPFDLQTKSYDDMLVPIVQSASKEVMLTLDTEMDNSGESGHGSLVPSNSMNTKSQNRMFYKNKERILGPNESVHKTRHIDKIIGYTMQDIY